MSFLLSGNHWMEVLNGPPSLVSCFLAPLPSAGMAHSSYSPVESSKYAIHLPSGLHAGLRSAMPSVRVMLRGTPFSAGALQMSPRAATATRLALGLMLEPCSSSLTSSVRVRTAGRSPGIFTSTVRDLPEPRSSTMSLVPFWKTISPSPMAGHLTSSSVKRVTCLRVPDFGSQLQMLSLCGAFLSAVSSDR